MNSDSRLIRLDANRLRVANPRGLDAVLFANCEVPVESAAIDELLALLKLENTVERFASVSPSSFDETPALRRVVLTPDFHKANGIPVGSVLATRGFAVPQAIGNDVNCGMRLHLTDIAADRLDGHLDELETAMRHLFFEGGRNIPMTGRQREALLRSGLEGLFAATPRSFDDGLWRLVHATGAERDLDRVERRGSLPSSRVVGLEDYIGEANHLSRDSQIGSIGGGNHFVEIQRVETILDGPTAYGWGMRAGMVTVMVHTGSLSVGHLVGGHVRDAMRTLFPPSLRHPENGVFVLPAGERHRAAWELFWDALHNAANFAFANRLFLALAAFEGLRRVLGESAFPLLYDAPHNFVWRETIGGEDLLVHRKGACPARGFAEMAGGPFAFWGEPVLVPGSMGASSFVLAGRGLVDSLHSASHGAGRALSRGDASRGHEAEFAAFLERFHVVTPVDMRRPEVRLRRDIVQRKLEELQQEAPFAYKGVGPVIDTLMGAGIAKPVAELRPIMTIKG